MILASVRERFPFILLAPLAACALWGCAPRSAERPGGSVAGDASSPGARQVTLALNWLPEAEHGGFYAALVHGFYREEGLEVDILPGGPGVPVIHNVATRRAHFGVANADEVLLGRAQDAQVVALFAPLQHSPRCIMVRKDSGIESFEDLRDVTLAIGVGKAFAEFLQKEHPLENVRVVPYTGGVGQFLRDKRFAQQAYVFSEPFLAEQAGVPARSLMLSDLGYDPYTSVLITHGDMAQKDPDLARKMVRASARGWKKYLQSPAETNERIHQLNPEMDLATLAYGAETLRSLSRSSDASEEEFGAMTLDRWQTLADQLVEVKLLDPQQADAKAAFRNPLETAPAAGAAAPDGVETKPLE